MTQESHIGRSQCQRWTGYGGNALPNLKHAKHPYKEFGKILREKEKESASFCTRFETSPINFPYGPAHFFFKPYIATPVNGIAFPTPTQAFILWVVYQENVAPLIPLLHKPSIQALLLEVSALPESLDQESVALLSAVYLSATISMTNDQCVRELGEDRTRLLCHFRQLTEMAFTKANLLGTESFTLLQAAVLYLSCIRKHDEESSSVWAMTTVIIRLARNIGLHWDGMTYGLGPFEIEMRRRLWWHICILDVRTSEDQGTESETLDMDFDTRLPLNINDEDISPAFKQPVQERVGFTETTFSIMRCEAILAVRLMRMSLNTSEGSAQPNPRFTKQCSEFVRGLERRLWNDYVSHCDLSAPMTRFYVGFARVLPKVSFVIHHPVPLHNTSNLPLDILDWFFMTAIESVEFGLFIESYASTAKWTWLFRQSSTRWYLLTFPLTEICVRPPCPSVDRAWLAVSSAYQEWGLATAGGEWRTVSKLMERVLSLRAGS